MSNNNSNSDQKVESSIQNLILRNALMLNPDISAELNSLSEKSKETLSKVIAEALRKQRKLLLKEQNKVIEDLRSKLSVEITDQLLESYSGTGDTYKGPFSKLKKVTTFIPIGADLVTQGKSEIFYKEIDPSCFQFVQTMLEGLSLRCRAILYALIPEDLDISMYSQDYDVLCFQNYPAFTFTSAVTTSSDCSIGEVNELIHGELSDSDKNRLTIIRSAFVAWFIYNIPGLKELACKEILLANNHIRIRLTGEHPQIHRTLGFNRNRHVCKEGEDAEFFITFHLEGSDLDITYYENKYEELSYSKKGFRALHRCSELLHRNRTHGYYALSEFFSDIIIDANLSSEKALALTSVTDEQTFLEVVLSEKIGIYDDNQMVLRNGKLYLLGSYTERFQEAVNLHNAGEIVTNEEVDFPHLSLAPVFLEALNDLVYYQTTIRMPLYFEEGYSRTNSLANFLIVYATDESFPQGRIGYPYSIETEWGSNMYSISSEEEGKLILQRLRTRSHFFYHRFVNIPIKFTKSTAKDWSDNGMPEFDTKLFFENIPGSISYILDLKKKYVDFKGNAYLTASKSWMKESWESLSYFQGLNCLLIISDEGNEDKVEANTLVPNYGKYLELDLLCSESVINVLVTEEHEIDPRNNFSVKIDRKYFMRSSKGYTRNWTSYMPISLSVFCQIVETQTRSTVAHLSMLDGLSYRIPDRYSLEVDIKDRLENKFNSIRLRE